MKLERSKIEALKKQLGTRSIVLIGLMGCGKSSVGRRLASALDLKFVDSDDAIETAAGKSITEIFADHGEPYFRVGEKRVIARLLGNGPQVLATGGGAFMNEETRAGIRAHGISVWLKAELPVLMKRVSRRQNRPLLKAPDPEGRMRQMMVERHPVYATADLTIESRDVPHEAMVSAIVEALLAGPLAASPSVAAPTEDASCGS